jgi:hypothetical protein
MKASLAACIPALILATGACASEPAPEPQTSAASPASSVGHEADAAKEAFDRAHHMQASLWLALSTRDALVDGALEDAKSSARALAAHDYAGTIPDAWKHWIGEVQKQAGEITIAADVDDASQSLAALALACGNCHYHHDAGPAVAPAPPVAWKDGPDTLDGRMMRHADGVAQMWAGLVLPSDDAWRAGTITITRAPIAAPITKDGTTDSRSSAALERVRGLAKRARTASTYAERGMIFGELIATCAHCHTTTPRSP